MGAMAGAAVGSALFRRTCPRLVGRRLHTEGVMALKVCSGSPNGGGGTDPAENVETQYELTLKKRWFRVKVLLGNADNVVSCWAVGFLEERLR